MSVLFFQRVPTHTYFVIFEDFVLILTFVYHLIYSYYDHSQCAYIPRNIKNDYIKLKKAKGVAQGKKLYWVTSAEAHGLRDGDEGIVFLSKFKK